MFTCFTKILQIFESFGRFWSLVGLESTRPGALCAHQAFTHSLTVESERAFYFTTSFVVEQSRPSRLRQQT